MSPPAAWVGLVALATAVDGLLAGASLDQSIKQLPARHRIGVLAFSEYSRASDLANGVLWYAALGVGGAGLTLAAAVGALVLGLSDKQRLPLLLYRRSPTLHNGSRGAHQPESAVGRGQ